MEILSQMGADGHEQLMVIFDPGSGLKVIISHDTTLGPAAPICGPTSRKKKPFGMRFGCPAP